MPIDHAGVGYRRLPGTYVWLIEQQQAAVIKPDLRLWDWSAEAKAHPQRSARLDKLLVGEPVVIG